MNILITGGSGFIGSNFIRYMMEQRPQARIINLDKLTYAGSRDNLSDLEKDPRYRFIHGDILDRGLLENVFAETPIDGLVHFAAESHVDNSIYGPEAFVQTNVLGTFTLLEAARKHWKPNLGSAIPQRFLHISTDEVFGSLGPEGYFNENSRYRPNSPYSASKASSDMWVRSYVQTFGLNAVITNCSNNYGPYQHAEKFIPTVIRTALAGEPIPVYGTGANVRDLLYVRDHCEALLAVFEGAKPGDQYVIGGGNEMSNLDLAHRICGILDEMLPTSRGSSYADQIILVEDRPGHDHRYAVDCAHLTGALGWRPRTPFSVGLKETVRWYKDKLKVA